jgi:predicted nucleic acid-binding protein
MTLTFIDAGVLIAAVTGRGEESKKALRIRDDPTRRFASTDFVRLETLPKAIFHAREGEALFYQGFFQRVDCWIEVSPELLRAAFGQASQFGLSALDSLHVAAARAASAEELITTEGPTKPLHRVTSPKIKSLRD